jgi:uncharacterized DUF497 family protein
MLVASAETASAWRSGMDTVNALGETSVGRRLHVTFTLRVEGTRTRVISARDMHRKERAVYEGQG